MLDAVTFQDDGSIVISVHPIRFHHCVGKGQRLVDAGNTIVQNNFGVFVHGAQDLAASQRRSHSISIRARVGGKDKPLALLDLL